MRRESGDGIRRSVGEGMTDETDIAAARERLRDTLVAVAGGDRAAFATLYKLTSAKLFGVCLRILGKQGDAEDVLQETYTTVWHKAGLYDPERASPITWLVMIARNKAIDRARADGGEPHAAPIELAADVGDSAAEPAARAEAADSGRRLAHASRRSKRASAS